MIIDIVFPTNISRVNYGLTTMIPDSNTHTLEVPDYVGKTMLTLPGVTGPALPQSAAELLAATTEVCETNYLFWSYGKPLPDEDQVTAASALLVARGVPNVSMF